MLLGKVQLVPLNVTEPYKEVQLDMVFTHRAVLLDEAKYVAKDTGTHYKVLLLLQMHVEMM